MQRYNSLDTNHTELQGKLADIMAAKMRLEKTISGLQASLDKEKTTQSSHSEEIDELKGKYFNCCENSNWAKTDILFSHLVFLLY